MRFIDITGQKFEYLTAIKRAEDKVYPSGKKVPTFLCKCDCGNTRIVVKSDLISGAVKSCGCKNFSFAEDLSGKKFGEWTVIEKYKGKDKPKGYYLCICSCGEYRVVNGNNLKYGKSVSCGKKHGNVKIKEDLTGRRFGRLEVIKQADDIEHGKTKKVKVAAWLCRCDCGNKCIITDKSLKNGTISCGCYKKENTSKRLSLNLEGKRFGRLTVIKRNGTYTGTDGTKYSTWLCKCDCGNTKIVRGYDLSSGKTHSCGCLMSKGQETICNILYEKNINFDTEYTFPDLLSDKKRRLRFDFCIKDDKDSLLFLIEYQGIQHYKEMENDFGKQQREITDLQKREYCNKKNIKLYEIKYDEDIYNKIEYILKENNL